MLDKFIGFINEEKDAAIAVIKSDAKKEIDGINLSIDGDIAALKSTIKSRTKNKITTLEQRERGGLEFAKRSKILSVKSKLFEEAKEKCINEMASISGGDYENILKKMVEQLPDLKDNAVVVAEEKTLPLLEKVLKNQRKNYKVAAQKNIGLGFIAKTDKIDYNQTLNSLFEDLWNENIKEIEKLLFA